MHELIFYVKELKKYYPILGGILRKKVAEVKAVDNVSFQIFRGECLGLVGESGCGKTTLGKTIIRLLNPTSGHIYFSIQDNMYKEVESSEQRSIILEELQNIGISSSQIKNMIDISTFKGLRLKKLRRKMQIVYQDPTTSLNPRMLVKDIVGEPLIVQNFSKKSEILPKVTEMLHKVGMGEQHLYRYPHEFSGGQRQRIAIARALITNPEFVVLDEPTSAVDVSVRAQLLELFQELQKSMGLTYLFVSHDLSIVECISHRVAVMYLGKIVELAETEEIFKDPLHPYTQALINSIPIPDPTRRRMQVALRGEVPSPINPPRGCRFHPRCSLAMDICRKEEPLLQDIGGSHLVACHAIKG